MEQAILNLIKDKLTIEVEVSRYITYGNKTLVIKLKLDDEEVCKNYVHLSDLFD